MRRLHHTLHVLVQNVPLPPPPPRAPPAAGRDGRGATGGPPTLDTHFNPAPAPGESCGPVLIE